MATDEPSAKPPPEPSQESRERPYRAYPYAIDDDPEEVAREMLHLSLITR